jgi:hypothetical protein
VGHAWVGKRVEEVGIQREGSVGVQITEVEILVPRSLISAVAGVDATHWVLIRYCARWRSPTFAAAQPGDEHHD